MFKIKSFLFITLLIKILSVELSIRDNCLDLPFNICGNDGSLMLTPLNKPRDLIGWWSFDDAHAYDHSGNGLDGVDIPEPGPSHYIKGYSAFFNGNSMMTIENHQSFIETSDLTITFWLYLLEDSTGNWRTIFSKGNTVQEITPTIMLWPKERRLHVRVSTENFWNEGIESRGIINMRQWVHISVVISGQMIQLYMNGNLDSEIILKGKVKMNNGKLHVGKDLWHSGVKCYIDELKIYKKALRSQEIEAEASTTNSLVGNRYLSLGCESCNFLQAMTSCKEGYHLCSFSELYSGGYQIARSNGWFKYSSDVWARESLNELEEMIDKNDLGNPNVLKMALCCSDK